MQPNLLQITCDTIAMDDLACHIQHRVVYCTETLVAASQKLVPVKLALLADSMLVQHKTIMIRLVAATGQTQLGDSEFEQVCQLISCSYNEFTNRYSAASQQKIDAKWRATDLHFASFNAALFDLRAIQCTITLAPGAAMERELVPIDPALVRLEKPVCVQRERLDSALIRGAREIPGSASELADGVDVDVIVSVEHSISEVRLRCRRSEAQTFYCGDNRISAQVERVAKKIAVVVGDYRIDRK